MGFVRSRFPHVQGRERLTSTEAVAVRARERALKVKDGEGLTGEGRKAGVGRTQSRSRLEVAGMLRSWWPEMACTGASVERLAW